MQIAKCALFLVVLSAVGMWAQQAATLDQAYRQVPDKDGVYFVGPQVSQPKLVHAVPAIYTDEMLKSKSGGLSVWSVVISADGTPADAHLVEPLGASFDAAAIDAINQSKFETGNLNGKPVNVHIAVAVPFRYGKYPAVPVVGIIERDLDPGDKHRRPANADPAMIHLASPSFSTDAIKPRYQGPSLVSVLVGEDGVPSDARILRALGMGLDEKAIGAVLRCRFRPAMKNGRPVSARISIAVNFLIY
jgi:TonB family protein